MKNCKAVKDVAKVFEVVLNFTCGFNESAEPSFVRRNSRLDPRSPYFPWVGIAYSSQACSQFVESGAMGVTITAHPCSMSFLDKHSIPPQ